MCMERLNAQGCVCLRYLKITWACPRCCCCGSTGWCSTSPGAFRMNTLLLRVYTQGCPSCESHGTCIETAPWPSHLWSWWRHSLSNQVGRSSIQIPKCIWLLSLCCFSFDVPRKSLCKYGQPQTSANSPKLTYQNVERTSAKRVAIKIDICVIILCGGDFKLQSLLSLTCHYRKSQQQSELFSLKHTGR